MSDAALFRPNGPSHYQPTIASLSGWDARIVHGAAVAALLAGRLAPMHGTLARLTVDFLAPVPASLLTLELGELRGGRRVTRRDAVLSSGGRPVVTATSLIVTEGDLELPDRASAHASPFDPAEAPPLDEPNRGAVDIIGHEGFDSLSAIVRTTRVEGDRRLHQWIALALPVVEGVDILGVETAVVAADYAQSAIHRQLPFDRWSYRNAEQTLHLSRPPVGSWVGARCEGVVQPVGAGFNSADLFDAEGRFGQSAAALVVERRGESRPADGGGA